MEAELHAEPDARSIAERTIDQIFDHYYLEVKDIDNENDASALKTSRNKLIKAVERGELIVEKTDEGKLLIKQKLVKTPDGGLRELVYREINGDMYCSMKNAQETDLYGKLYLLVGASTGVSAKNLKNLLHPDLTTVQQLGLVFMQV